MKIARPQSDRLREGPKGEEDGLKRSPQKAGPIAGTARDLLFRVRE